jgi:anion-transporting  ArsA/GET3 family ATPase
VTNPKVLVCAGGGGVGKTTSSAALALALARTGERTLVVTVDPARRLAQAMGIAIDPDVHAVHLEGEPQGTLFALMPEPRASTKTFVELLFEGEPEAYERVLKNRIYATLGDALAGIHELVSLMLVARAVEEAEYDYLVVDTAPSRYALDFVSYPGRLASLFEGRAVGWFGNLADKARSQRDSEPPEPEKGGLLAWGRKRVEATLARILDPQTILDVTNLFAELTHVRHRFAALARASEALLLGKSTRYVLVAAPTGASEADAAYIAERLSSLHHEPRTVLLNRADPEIPAWVKTLRAAKDLTLPVQQATEILEGEIGARKAAGDRLERELRRKFKKAHFARLPTFEARDPSVVVRSLADSLGRELPSIVK